MREHRKRKDPEIYSREKTEGKKKVWAFFMDLKAAFDRIDRGVLWEMMRRRGLVRTDR